MLAQTHRHACVDQGSKGKQQNVKNQALCYLLAWRKKYQHAQNTSSVSSMHPYTRILFCVSLHARHAATRQKRRRKGTRARSDTGGRPQRNEVAAMGQRGHRGSSSSPALHKPDDRVGQADRDQRIQQLRVRALQCRETHTRQRGEVSNGTVTTEQTLPSSHPAQRSATRNSEAW